MRQARVPAVACPACRPTVTKDEYGYDVMDAPFLRAAQRPAGVTSTGARPGDFDKADRSFSTQDSKDVEASHERAEEIRRRAAKL